MKAYYFSQCNTTILGPTKKINDQVKTFNEAGIKTELIRPKKSDKPFSFWDKLLRRFPFTPVLPTYQYEQRFKDADAYYIRFGAGDLYFTNFLKKLRKNNQKAKIILEFADFPYVHTLLSFTRFPIWLKDRLYYKQYKKYVDRVANLTNLEYIYGIKTIHFINGIVVSDVVKKSIVTTSDTIHMIGVAGMWYFHGYDRIIKGLYEFYKNNCKQNIVMHLVGDGPELDKYKSLVEKYGLEQHVIFYGNQTGHELDEIYNKCEIGVASLGLHRMGLSVGSFLKTREYLAKGLPMITACEIDILDSSYPYFHKFPENESAIDIEKIIEFYNNTYLKSGKDKQEIIDEIRDFSYKTCDMKVSMKPIIDYLTVDSL